MVSHGLGTDDDESTLTASLRPLTETDLDDGVAWALVDAAPDGIVLADERGSVLVVNRQLESMFGYDRGDLLGRSVDELLPERFRQVHRAHRTRYRVEPRTRPMGVGIALFGCRRDGSEFPLEISLSPLTTERGVLVVAVVRDISDRMAAEADTRRVHDLLDATRDGVFIFDEDLRFTYVNSGAEQQVGYSRDELLAMTPLHIAPQFTESEFRALLAPLVAGDTASTRFVTEHRRRDGVDITVEVVLQVQDGAEAGSRSFVAMVRDVRERLETEQRLREAERELHTLEDHERIARDLHDIVIQQLFASGMTLQGVWSRIKEPEVAQRIETVVDDLDRTIREIRSVIFGLQAHEHHGDRNRLAILSVVADERDALGFEPRVRFDGPVESMSDQIAGHLLATLREALSNVAKHAGASQAQVTVDAGSEIVLRVEDDGIGITDVDDTSGNGVRNMRERAVQCGGECRISGAPNGGTVLEWRVPKA